MTTLRVIAFVSIVVGVLAIVAVLLILRLPATEAERRGLRAQNDSLRGQFARLERLETEIARLERLDDQMRMLVGATLPDSSVDGRRIVTGATEDQGNSAGDVVPTPRGRER